MSHPHRPRLLFTGGGGAASEALHRLLSDRYYVHFADADPDAKPETVPQQRWHAIPFANHPSFVTALSALCRSIDVDVARVQEVVGSLG